MKIPRNGLHRKRGQRKMFIEWLKKSKPEIFEMIQRNPTARSKLKSIESTWKQIESILQNDLKLIMKGKI